MSVLILEPDAYSPVALDLYRSIGAVHLGEAPDAGSVRVLVVRLAHYIDASMLRRFPVLEAVVTPTTGHNHIDEAACAEAEVAVYSLRAVPEALERVTSTSELTLGLILSLVRHIPMAHADVVIGNDWERDRFKGRQVAGLKLGLVGLGRIGRHVAGYARALGMQVAACDPIWPETGFEFVTRRTMPQVLAESDIVSLHVKHDAATHHLIGAEEIAAMQPGALLINTARGELLDETAAVGSLRSGHLGGLAVDVLSDEVALAGDVGANPVVKAARDGFNVIVTPHIGGCSQDAMHVTEDMMARYCLDRMGYGTDADV